MFKLTLILCEKNTFRNYIDQQMVHIKCREHDYKAPTSIIAASLTS
jgi:hypothetical protein